jgi:type I restriction enzyme, S subunit
MNGPWPKVRLGEVLELAIDAVPVDTTATYNIAGVYSFGRGLFCRGPLAGTATTYKELHRLHADDVVLSQLKGWEGAVARVPLELEGWFLSPQFPTFRAIRTKVNVGYLDWFLRRPEVWQGLRQAARGMGARRDSVSPERFLTIEMPLPPLPEQRRIVARIEELAGKIVEAKRLHDERVEARNNLLVVMAHRADWSDETKQRHGWRPVRLGEVMELALEPHVVNPDMSYPNLGIYSYSRGLFSKLAIDGSATSAGTLFRVRRAQFIYSKLFAFEGAYPTFR